MATSAATSGEMEMEMKKNVANSTDPKKKLEETASAVWTDKPRMWRRKDLSRK